jgi:hypothetical protein
MDAAPRVDAGCNDWRVSARLGVHGLAESSRSVEQVRSTPRATLSYSLGYWPVCCTLK